ncbi:hypothetical protein BH11BAC3_BH11BAC3_27670 [soil metagenome]
MIFSFFLNINAALFFKQLPLLFITSFIYFSTTAQTKTLPGNTKNADTVFPKTVSLGNSDSLERSAVHLEIDQLQANILKIIKAKLTGKSSLHQSGTAQISGAVITIIDSIQQSIETSLALKASEKLLYFTGWKRLLDGTLYAVSTGELEPGKIPMLFNCYQSTLDSVATGNSILPIIKANSLTLGGIILKAIQQENAIDLNEGKYYVVSKTLELNPSNFFPVFFDFPNVLAADSLLAIAARKLPEDLYTFSQAKNSLLGKRIANSTDSLVHLIRYIASFSAGQQYFPFLDELYHKKITIPAIKKVTESGNRVDYFKLLVKTQTSYKERLRLNDTAIAYQATWDKLSSIALSDYVYEVNGQHEYPDNIRLKVLEPLTARELYYICIAGVNDLYTSSFLKIYDKIFKLQQVKGSYDLFQTVHFDYYKRFIKMAGTFNTLDDFLSRMKKDEADSVIKSFVNGLDIDNNFEDAVDVADSYASIKNERLRTFILNEIKTKLPVNDQPANNSAPGIYEVLYNLFLSLDTANHINLSALLGIPPVYRINNNQLKSDSGKIIIQQFFYGDDDGKYSYSIFFKTYNNPNWKITGNKYWIKCASQRGTVPVEIYANLPLDDNSNQDLQAQQKLSDYLKENNLQPSVIIHRGHSYHVKNTLKFLTPESKLVFLGSCGGYTNLKKVFAISPMAHLITTKQEGTGTINQPMLDYITVLLRNNGNLDWPEIWQALAVRFKNNARFDDYVPPHQNLGAILMMAYYKQHAAVKTAH